MKRKRLVAVGILSVCLLACGCGSNATVTSLQKEQALIGQETETQEEMQGIATQEEGAQEPQTQEETVEETESQSTEPEDGTYWDKVGIEDGIATVYDGTTLQMEEDEEVEYIFFKPASFLQFAHAELSYGSVNLKFEVEEEVEWQGICSITSSGNYELEAGTDSEDQAYIYADGDCIGLITVAGISPAKNQERTLDECKLVSLEIYPKVGITLNGYEFKDCQMRNVIEYFGDPNTVSYEVKEDGSDEIIYEYKLGISTIRVDKTTGKKYKQGNSSSYKFYTTDGKNIERIVMKLNFTDHTAAMSERSEGHYYLGDSIELKQVFIDWDENGEDVYGDVAFKVDEIDGDILRGYISISNLVGTFKDEIDFIIWNNLICYIWDEDYMKIDYEITYSPSDNDAYDYALSFKIKDIEKATYLRFAGHWLDSDTSNQYMYEVLVKLK